MAHSRHSLDRRRHAYRDDLAAMALKNQIDAPAYAEAAIFRVVQGNVPLRKAPDALLPYESELVFGERVDVYDIKDGWAWVQARRDGYVGYLPQSALAPATTETTHRIADLRAFVYPGPSIKATPLAFLPYGSEVTPAGQEGKFTRIETGWVYTSHIVARAAFALDPVSEAERFLGIPYLWGGKSSLGIDCSGLVQTVCFACGIFAPRDSDMQEAELGEALDMPADPATLPRGCLLFWPGHVALAQGNGRMIHANAFHMKVQSEEIAPALARIAAKGSVLRSVRRLPHICV